MGASDAVGGVGVGGDPFGAENMGSVDPSGEARHFLLQKRGGGAHHRLPPF